MWLGLQAAQLLKQRVSDKAAQQQAPATQKWEKTTAAEVKAHCAPASAVISHDGEHLYCTCCFPWRHDLEIIWQL